MLYETKNWNQYWVRIIGAANNVWFRVIKQALVALLAKLMKTNGNSNFTDNIHRTETT